MNHIKLFESWKEERKTNEGFWNSIFGNPTVKDAAKSNLRGQGHSIIGKDEDEENYVMYNGQKFYPSQIEYDDYHSTKPLPRVEDGKLIIANPAWSM